MTNAVALYDAGKIRVACAVSHYRETTMGLCVDSLDKMDANFAGRCIVSGKSPMCASFNASLDYACDIGAELLFHTATDVIVEPFALRALLEVMNFEDNYLAVGKGYDPMFGEGASVGIWVWNLNILKREFRFRDVFKQDMDLCERIETATGKSRVYTEKFLRLGYHHPIWTAEELYMKMRYSYPKYSVRRKNDMRNFVMNGLARNPTNRALLAGVRGLENAEREGAIMGSKNNDTMQQEFKAMTADLGLNGTEYYVEHHRFKSYAMTRMKSLQPCVAVDEPQRPA